VKRIKKIRWHVRFLHFNKKKNVITFGSDPQGEKRLYKFENEEFFLISSNPKAILKFFNINQRLNKNVIKRYFHTRHFTLIDDTIFKNIEILKPGNVYRYSLTLKKLKRKSFDNPIDWIDKNLYFRLKNAGYKKTKEEFKSLLLKTAHKMVPKINFSTIITGGIDSTLISYILKNYKNHKTL
jgi:asparagine synthetase B (glutamine-hydrolysing)